MLGSTLAELHSDWATHCKGGSVLKSYDLCGDDPKPMTKREVDALKQLMGDLPRNPVVIQIGAERGVSTMAMLEKRPDAFIFSIDYGERPEEFENLEKGELPRQRVVRGLGHSQDIGRFWPQLWQCHLLYIDGDHRRPGIDWDISFWLPAVMANGVVAFHDVIHPDERGPHIHGRVWEAVEELVNLEPILYVHRLKAFRQHHEA